MVEVRWSPLAAADYESIINFYEKSAPKFAQNFAKKIFYIIENLTQFPKMGRKVPESDNPNIREIIYRNFRIIYRLKKEIIEIIRIVHGTQILKL